MTPEPTRHSNYSPARKWAIAVVFSIIGAALLWLIIGIATSSTSSTSRANDPDRMRMEAIAHCEDRVRDELRSPSTADFDSDARRSSGTWQVSGTVDAENGFGATVRADYTCTATITHGQVTSQLVSLDQR